jgi:pimeloyl-ACP methyl ester carboxylesterase
VKPKLALLPGLLCDARLWAHQARHLAELADPWIADLTAQDSIAAMADDVLARLPRRFALAGLSMGGYVALEIVRRAPERVTRLCLIDTSARPDTDDQAQRRRGLIAVAASAKGTFRGVTRRLLRFLVHPDRVSDPDLTGTIMTMAETVGRDAYIRQQRAIAGRPDFRPILPAIACPTMVICGRQDAVTPLDRSEEIAAAIPGARLAVIEDCGHLAALERPQAVTALMRLWLL